MIAFLIIAAIAIFCLGFLAGKWYEGMLIRTSQALLRRATSSRRQRR